MEEFTINWRDSLKEWEKTHSQAMSSELTKLREEFIKRFPLESLASLTLEEYALGQENKDNFCNWLEFKTKHLLAIGGVSSSKHGIWWSKETSQWKWNKKLNCDTPQAAFEVIKQGLLALLNAAKFQKFDQLDQIANQYPNSNLIRAKVLYLYFPDDFLPIASYDHLSSFFTIFNLSPVKGFHTQNRQLLQFLSNQTEFKDYDVKQISSFLYDCFDPRNNLEDQSIIENDEGENDFEDENENESESVSKLLDTINQTITKTHNIILYGVPGTGKTYLAKVFAERFLSPQIKALINDKLQNVDFFKYLEIVTFHQSFAYEEFIEGIKPETDETGKINYQIKDGIFKEICQQAQQDPDHNYILIIDEINRANISKVFGELITLLEDDKRLGNKNQLTVKLPYSKIPFGIPKNLYLIATMNTTDRSIALPDVALRRRFTFLEINPDPSLLPIIENIDLSKLLSNLNEKITLLLGEDYQIGHSYLLNLQTIDDLQFVWYYKIIPLLKEYFYNNWQKLQAILGNQFIVKKSVSLSSQDQENLSELIDMNEVYKINHLSGDNFKTALKNAFRAISR